MVGAIMEAMREAWTDRRLDGLNHKVEELERLMDARFDEVNARLDRFEGTMDNRLGSLEDRFASFQQAMIQMTGLIVAALIGVIATQL